MPYTFNSDLQTPAEIKTTPHSEVENIKSLLVLHQTPSINELSPENVKKKAEAKLKALKSKEEVKTVPPPQKKIVNKHPAALKAGGQ
jgi:hypothetical protein